MEARVREGAASSEEDSGGYGDCLACNSYAAGHAVARHTAAVLLVAAVAVNRDAVGRAAIGPELTAAPA